MFNSITIVLGFAGGLVWLGGYKADIDKSIKDNTAAIEQLENKEDSLWSAHADLHKERLAETKATDAALSERIRALEARENDLDRKLDNVTYRTTVLEQSSVSFANSQREVQSVLNKLNADLQVVKEISVRMEARIKKTSFEADEIAGCPDDKPIWISSSGIYHEPKSPWRTRMKPVVCLGTVQEAVDAGYRPPMPFPKVPAAAMASAP